MIRIPDWDLASWLMVIVYALCGAVIISLGLSSLAKADDRVIQPQCWEENVGGEVHRNCEVKAPPRVVKDRPLAGGYYPPSPPPPAYYGPPYPGYQSTLSPRYFPGVPQQGRNWANPCTPYVCGYGSPYGYGYPPPYYGPPPLVFGFGPFSIWIP
jgi:hypothetical protein